uniref:Retrovirus-related Pol polyprotein from transposon TNT 1-94 n=1 Tax=Cajanus cajan TaxID=3821 RepID=A0A151RT77_CAJCA|nr:Retrovirus-related Pol polyprotein from transposon TNT 1-94 [Cajanus cajan]
MQNLIYKARPVTQGLSHRPCIDFEETYSPVVDANTFRYLVSLVVHEKLNLHLIDVVTAYLYGSLDADIYMKLPEGFNFPDDAISREDYSIKLNKSLYCRMLYNRLSEYLLQEGYKNDPICLCIFIKGSENGFTIIVVYVDDINIIETPEELSKAIDCLKKEFEMKDLGRTKFCLGLQVEYLENEILVHQEAYITKVLKRFYMDKSNLLCIPMVVRSLDVNKDPYLSAIGALMYLANYTRPDIAFAVNLLARYSSSSIGRHWNEVKQILRYLKGTMDMGLLYSNVPKPELNSYADAGYLSDPHNGKSQTGYLFTSGGTTIS